MADVLVVTEHLGGALQDITFELLAHAKTLAGQVGGGVTALVVGGDSAMVGQLGAAKTVYTVQGSGDFNPATHGAALEAVVTQKSPRVVLIGSTSMGMDLAAWLAGRKQLPLAAYCISVGGEGGSVKAVSQIYGGKMRVTSDLGGGTCVVTMLPGYAQADDGRVPGQPALEAIAPPADSGKVRFKRLIKPEAGDVDITAKDVLVAIGRGIGKKEDIEVAEELAEKLGAAVAASRPIIDAGWLPKSRQVGKSGLKVKPKVYLALGISGAPEHLEGMKGSSTIIAINTDKNAPIFDVAHYGLVADLFDACEELTEAI